MRPFAALISLAAASTIALVGAQALALPRASLPKPKPGMLGPAGEPGSGTPREPTGRTPGGRLSAPLPTRPHNDTEEHGLTEMEQMLLRYRSAHTAAQETVGHLLVLGAVQGKRQLEAHYERAVRDKQARTRALRAAAAKRYEDFLRIHPDHITWTPEIMFRLAELQFEIASERLARQEEAYNKALAALQEREDGGKDIALPASPTPEYQLAIKLFREVATRFPQYTHYDASLYMMGLLLFEEERVDASRQAFLALICAGRYEVPNAAGSNIKAASKFMVGDYEQCQPARPNSRFLAESWLRLGEMHYDMDELDPALEAYRQAARNPEDELYDEALIRLAWTLYLRRDFADAAKHLDEFVRYADSHKNDEHAAGAVQLRGDAVTYIAKCYVEEDWDKDGRRDRVWGYDRLDQDYRERGGERHVPEIYAALGDLFAYQTEFRAAVEIWQETLKRWPLAAAAPAIHLRVLQAYEALHDREGATRARDLLATNYLRGTPWFHANENDPEAIEKAFELAESALVATAIDHHQRAQALRSADDPKAAEEYAIAARAYEAFLSRFPDAPSAYEYRYQYAESLFYSGQFAPAARQYVEVRDSNLDNRLQTDAALGAVSAYEATVQEEKQAGRLELPDMPKKGTKGPFDPKPIPPLVAALQDAYDRHVAIRPDAKQSAATMFLAAEISQRYHHLDDAEARFARILEQHCDQNVAINAGMAIIDAHVVREDLKGTREWTERLMKLGCGEGDESKKFAGDLKTIGNAVRFQEASQLFDAGEFEAAADRYVALVDQAPGDPNADRALNNAAVAYEKIGRFSSASKTYQRIYTKYPNSEFADNALLRTGLNHVKFFEFEEAVKSYLILAEDKRYENSEYRLLALRNAADLLDNLQQYTKASARYRTYAGNTKDAKEAAEANFMAAEVLRKTNDHKATIKAYREFLSRYQSSSDEAVRTTEAHLRIGQEYASMGDRKSSERAYGDCIAAFRARGLAPATDPADFPAEAQFLLAEYAMQDVLGTDITGEGKVFEKNVKAFFDKVKAASQNYDAVFPYRRVEWVLAAMFRRGYAFEYTAIKMRAAPVPRKLKPQSEAWYAYKELIALEMQRFEDEAVRLYEETLKRAKEFGIASEWTQRARERINIYRPQDYPLLHEPAIDLQVEDRR